MSETFDPDVKYSGPKAEFASITGSPIWGMSVSEIVEAAREHGWTHHFGERVPTPYGFGPLLNHFTTAEGRDVIWIPSYGMVAGERFFSPVMSRHVFWLLWQAGVNVLLVGGTSGTADWRDPEGEDTVRPGDFVLPWSFYRNNDAVPGTLPGTDMATGFLPRIALMADPFCVSLSRTLANKVSAELVPKPFRKVHTPDSVKVSIQMPPGGGAFETDFEIMFWRNMTKLISMEEGFPHVMIYGDVISPVLARHVGAHLLYYHIPSNWGQGHPATKRQLTDSLDDYYVNVLPRACLQMELELLETVDIPSDCTCMDNLKERPAVYLESVSPAAD